MSEQNSCCQEWRDDCNKHLLRIATLEQQNAELVAALEAIKGRVCGEAMPNWENTPNTWYSRGLIADEVDIALSKVKP